MRVIARPGRAGGWGCRKRSEGIAIASDGKNFIKFLGTAGARIVVSRQLRASGGLWLSLSGVNIHVDPGPGALVRCLSSKPKLDPAKLDAIILTHRHLDHSNDVNIMVEAMTTGGFSRRGILFAPADALDMPGGVVHGYLRGFPEGIEVLCEGGTYSVGGVEFQTPVRHKHQTETYGLRFKLAERRISLITDTLFFPELARHYAADLVILNVVRLKGNPGDNIYHLTMDDAGAIVSELRPAAAVLTHFGMTMLQRKPWELARELENQTGVKVIAASDGMTLWLDELLG